MCNMQMCSIQMCIFSVKCSKCNQLGHKDDQCPRPVWKCYLCKEYGHASVRCPTKQQGMSVRRGKLNQSKHKNFHICTVMQIYIG